ncbi:hypothetical protein Pint_19574 [Pistacia integerrima]|uniref:Uncharacterized protein n=1 Tax=Pistacia integerrima TaxID=434235 RepID=A0ACC0XCF6_9ROSI|nr:hypothetical protein Pint_19574 [Pistacia integerrima]
MKILLVVLFVIGLVSLHLQADARRFTLEVDNGATVDSVPSVAAKNDKTTRTSSNVQPDDSTGEVNHSYENYGNPSGSSTDSHHVYTNDCWPKKSC